MFRIFVDTSALFALYNDHDPHHLKAVEIYNKHAVIPGVELTISTQVVSECVTLISQRISKKEAIRFITSLENLVLVYLDEESFLHSVSTFKKVNSKNISFADCTSFAICRKLRIKDVFSFDQHFQKQGFSLLK